MTDKLLKLAKTLHPARLSSLAAYLLKDEAISGKLILIAVAAALIAANTSLASSYQAFWNTGLSIGLGDWSISLDLRHWVTEGLMAFFFLVVGLELKRELTHGELKTKQAAMLPLAAALGGMIVPALIYFALNTGGDTIKGWAIPMATDIALAIGILALLGKRIPSSIRIFLLALAIVDDIAAVIVIAVFYTASINFLVLGIGFGIIVLLLAMRNNKFLTLPLFVLAGIGLWLATYNSGIHPSIAGAALGLLAPMTSRRRSEALIAERLEKAIIPFSTLLVVPLFAFANTGISLSLEGIEKETALPIAGGIILGLVVGKTLGILGASWLVIRLGYAKLPVNANWNHVFGVGLLAGIGFTVSIFVTELAFNDIQYITVSKLSIFAASAISAALGLFVLRSSSIRRT